MRCTIWSRATLAALLALPAIGRAQQPSGPLASLPLSTYRPTTAPVGGAIFLSGDGGWHSFDDANGDSLRGMGYLVLGVNDLRLFAREMPGDSLAAVMRALTGWLRSRLPAGAPLWLLGYSFGADIATDAFARGADVDGVVLLGPGERGVRHVTLEGFLFREPTGPTSYDNAERLNTRACVPIAFITGGDDQSAKGAVVFPRVRQPAAAFIVPDAGHHYHGGDARYTAVLREALAWLRAHRCPSAP